MIEFTTEHTENTEELEIVVDLLGIGFAPILSLRALRVLRSKKGL